MKQLTIDILDYRRKKRITQKELADMCGVTPVTISHIEQERHNPTKKTEAMIREIIGKESE